MGYSSHSLENLGEPFLFADEMVFMLPKGGELTITKDQFKLLFVLKGEFLHDLDGFEEPKPLKVGDILVCPGFRSHRYINPSQEHTSQLHIMRLFLDGDAIRKRSRTRVRRPEFHLTDFVYHHFNRTVQCTGGIDAHITECLNALRREAEGRELGFRHRARSLCTDLLIAVARTLKPVHDKDAPATEMNASFLVASAKEYILKNLTSKLTLGEIAWQVGKGEEHLARTFKRETGQSVFDFVREMRINQAKTYLIDSNLSLGEVGERCGFNSLSFFSRSFHEIVGVTPSAYRQNIGSSTTLNVMPASPSRHRP